MISRTTSSLTGTLRSQSRITPSSAVGPCCCRPQDPSASDGRNKKKKCRAGGGLPKSWSRRSTCRSHGAQTLKPAVGYSIAFLLLCKHDTSTRRRVPQLRSTSSALVLRITAVAHTLALPQTMHASSRHLLPYAAVLFPNIARTFVHRLEPATGDGGVRAGEQPAGRFRADTGCGFTPWLDES